MSANFSTNERKAIGLLSLEELVKTCRAIGTMRIGANHRLLLNEFSLRFDVPVDSVSLAMVQQISRRDPTKGCAIRHWGIYSEDRVATLRSMPGRSWNLGCKCNSFVAESEADPKIFDEFKKLYAKTVVITESGFRVDEGHGSVGWTNPLLYKLNNNVLCVNLGSVLDGYFQLRPSDHPHVIALHGEYDEKYRTLFDESLPARRDDLMGIELQTRHEMLMFRVPQTNGKPRYLVYSVADNSPLEVLFAESKDLNLRLSQFKEAQMRLKAPLIESVVMPVANGDKQPVRQLIRRGVPSKGCP